MDQAVVGSNPTTHPKLFSATRAGVVFALGFAFLPSAAGGASSAEPGTLAEARPASLESERRAASALSLSGPPRDAAGFAFTSGRLVVRFSSGSAVDVTDMSGLVGVFVRGSGTASLDTAGALAPAALDRNLADLAPAAARARRKGEAGSPPAQAGPARFNLSWALVFLSEGAGPSLAGDGSADSPGPPGPAGSSAPPGQPIPPALRTAFDRSLENSAEVLGWDFPARRIGSRLGGSSALTLVHLDGRTRLVYRADAARGIEELDAVTDTADGRRQAEPIGQFPLGPALLSPPGADPRFVLEEAALSLRIETPPALAVTADLALRAGLLPGRIVSLHLDRLEVLRESLPAGPGEQVQVRAHSRLGGPGIRVSAVRDSTGAALDFTHAGNTLLVSLAEAPLPGARFHLVATLDTDLARLPAGYEFFTLRTNGWLPIPHNQYDRFGVTWDIHSHPPFLPVAGGIVPMPAPVADAPSTPVALANDPFHLAGALPVPVRLPLLACGRFIGTGADALLGKRRVPVSVWTYAVRNPQAEPIARYCAGALGFFSKLFGPYMFDRLDVVESVQASGGLSGPGILMVEGMDVAEIARTRRILGAAAFNMTFAHETAHQWWGQKVALEHPEDQWMIEALAEYSAWLYVREIRAEFGERVVLEWNRRSAASSGIVPLGEAWALSGSLARLHRANLVYGKGALMLRALGRKAGEEKFIAALGAFAEEFSGRAAGPDDLLRTLSRETGADLASDWSRWVDQTGQ